jgi:hypothetical protein
MSIEATFNQGASMKKSDIIVALEILAGSTLFARSAPAPGYATLVLAKVSNGGKDYNPGQSVGCGTGFGQNGDMNKRGRL